MWYDGFREQDYPIGSATVASGANTVVHHHMRRPGRAWKRDNGQAILVGLSELHGGRFDATWQAICSPAAMEHSGIAVTCSVLLS